MSHIPFGAELSEACFVLDTPLSLSPDGVSQLFQSFTVLKARGHIHYQVIQFQTYNSCIKPSMYSALLINNFRMEENTSFRKTTQSQNAFHCLMITEHEITSCTSISTLYDT